jgi:outer membrane receptor protein involved in Fe transport
VEDCRRRIWLALGALVAVVCLLGASPSAAQVLYGSVTGIVRDSSGASVPGATVTITNRATGLALGTTSNETGSYTVTNVPAGNYDAKVSLQGFKEFLQTDVPVGIGAIARVDITLELGALTETVTVQSQSSLLQTDKADVHVDLKSREITSLPLANYRNYQTLINLVPGATPGGFQNAITDTPARSLTTNVNGTNRNNNNTRLDGSTSVFIWLPHHTAYVPPAETIDTVNITTNNFDAETGMAGGAAVTVITKSGTNDFRGSAFWGGDNEKLQSRWAFLPENQDKPDSNRSIVGGTLGGPISKNRLFFFGAFEGTYERTGFTRRYTVPTAALRNGDFSGVSTTIYDPSTGAADGTGRAAFGNNQIPSTSISEVARKMLALLPMPNLPGEVNNYSNSGTQKMDRPNYDFKVNWNRTSSHQIWGKYSLMDATVFGVPGLGEAGGQCLCSGGIGTGDTKVQVGTFGTTWTVGPQFVIDGTFGVTQMDQTVTGQDFGQNFGLDVLGIPGTNGPDPRQGGQPIFNFPDGTYSDLGNIDGWEPIFRNDRSYTANVNFTNLRGRHELRYGYDLIRHELNHWQPEIGGGPRGRFTYAGGATALNGGPSPDQFNMFADFLLGLPTNEGNATAAMDKSLQYEEMTGREWQHAFYVRDRWTVNDKLTLSLGLRYEYYPIMTRANRGLERLLLNETLPFPGAAQEQPVVLLGGLGGNPEDVGLKSSKSLFAPRLGAAYRFDERTVVRAGWGRTFNPLPWSRPLRGFYPLTIAAGFFGPNAFTPFRSIEEGIPEIVGPDLSTGRVALDPSAQMRTPEPENVDRGYIDSWNLTYERRLPLDLVASVAYVGTASREGYADIELNAVETGGTAARPLNVLFGRTSSTLSWGSRTRGNYHSLQVAVNRPFLNGLLLRGAYTLSRAKNETDDDGWAGLSWNSPSMLSRNYALAGYDRTHVFQMGVVYALPFGQGDTTPLKAIIRDWQVNTLISAYTGRPFIVTAPNTTGGFGNQQTANQVGEPTKTGDKEPFGQYYELSAWEAPAAGQYGTSGRNSVRGPGLGNTDFSVFRNFPIGPRVRVEGRLEVFNLFNTTHYDNPSPATGGVGLSTGVTNSDFMQLTSGPQDQRQMRIGLRLSF